MKNECSNKEEALGTIKSLFPIGQSNESDSWWLEEIEKYGIENLPEELLIAVANRQLLTQF